ncbi:unnamed protein product, partial [Rotaria sp. Silwood1]
TLSIKADNLIEMVITNLDTILISLTDFYSNRNYDSSLLIEELSRSISLSSSTTILHKLSIVHSHISLLISFCKISKNAVRNLLINFLSNEIGIRILKNLNKLCLTLIYEKSIFLSLCSFETNIIENDLTTNEIFIKTLKPLLYVSSKLSQALSEFYNLLAKQCATSQMKPISRCFNQQSFVYTPTKAATLVASILIEVLKDGLLFNLSTNTNLTENQIEKFRLTFFICTIGFAIPMLFDKHHRPYMLMLQQFELSNTQDALFSALEWTLNLINRQSLITNNQQNTNDSLSIEFLNSAFIFILHLVNIKSILESPYSISKKSQTEQNDNISFNPLDYLILTHKHTFHLLTNSCSILWDKPYLLKDHATKIINNILSILSHILSGETQIQKQIQEEEEQQQQTFVSLEFFDNFINSIILKILDKLPDTIYKISELILTIIHHNDIKWCENFLEIIFNDIKTNYLLLIDLLNQQIFLNNHQNSLLFNRILLILLLFKEIPFPCLRITKKYSLINYFSILIHHTTKYLIQFNQKISPKWLTLIFLYIDLYENISLITKNRSIINENSNHIWQWFDENLLKWTNYPLEQNKQINNAYFNGNSSCKIIMKNQNYLIEFNKMLQINENTHNEQPIMLTFDKSIIKINTNELLSDEQAFILINNCVDLIRTLVDSDTIHAVLRLILRLTRNYKYVQQFVEKGGIKAILNLTEISVFQGYTSLIILIFRHIMEDKKNLCLTMKKSIRQALIDNHNVQYDSHEFNLILRKLSPAIARSSDIFLEVISNVLQLLPTSFMTENEYYTQTNIQMNSLILQVRPETNQIINYDQIGELAEHLLDDLLNFLLINDDNNKKRLLTKSTILYILSELINSYSNMDKFLSTKTFLLENNQTCSLLSYIFDYLLLNINNQYDKNITKFSELFLITLAKSNHYFESQNNLINQIKISLNKILNLPESNEKYIKIQTLINFINKLMESCSISKLIINNNTINLIYKHNLINDLTKIIHYIQISNPKLIDTINLILKSIETLSNIINYLKSLHKSDISHNLNVHLTDQTSLNEQSDDENNDEKIHQPSNDLISNFQDIRISTTDFLSTNSTVNSSFPSMNISILHPLLVPPNDNQLNFNTFSPFHQLDSILIRNDIVDSKSLKCLHDQTANKNLYKRHTTLSRWIEESIILDGSYVHDIVFILKSKIIKLLEKQDEEYKNHTENINNKTSIIDIYDKQLLDYESICCLLVLLFINDTHLNFHCLQNIIKNLCYHKHTRQWIIKSLLSIINKSTGRIEYDESIFQSEIKNLNSLWLNIYYENAFGIHKNLFKIEYDNLIEIFIDEKLCSMICCQVFDLLILLYKYFPEEFLFLPLNNNQQIVVSFWELIYKINQSFNNYSNINNNNNNNNNEINFQSSPLDILLLMFKHPILNKNKKLIDKLFKLLSLISQTLTKRKYISSLKFIKTTNNSQQENNKIILSDNKVFLDNLLDLFIKTLISKSCTEYGLEFANLFLLNISKINQVTKDKVLHLLINGIHLLSKDVNEEFKQLHLEIEDYLSKTKSNTTINDDKPFDESVKLFDLYKAIPLMNNDLNTKQKYLQLPSIIALTSKTGNQQFLLHILKLIIQLNEETKKEQIDIQSHFETELSTLTQSLETLRLSLSSNNNNQQNDILQSINELNNRVEQICINLQTILNSNTIEQHHEKIINEIHDIYHLIQQIEPSKQFLSFQQTKLNDLLNLNQLWDSLNDYLLSLSKLSDSHAVLIIQPIVEVFFLIHTVDLKKKDRETSKSSSHLECFGPTSKFIEFVHKHRIVLNQILRQSKQHLNEGPFNILINYLSLLDFDIKRKYFNYELDRLKENQNDKYLTVHIKRNNVFEDSYKELSQYSSQDWKYKFHIIFDDEEGQDADDILNEWYSIISNSILDPNHGLFMKTTGDHITYMPNPLSYYNKNYLEYFKFIGHFIGKIIFDKKYMNCYFTHTFYKYIIDKPIDYTDMKLIDLEFYKKLVRLLENDIQQLGLNLTFSLDVNEFGVNKTIELIENGSNIKVTNENKSEYIRFVCQENITGSIKQQINSFLEGFYEIIPKNLISIFNEQELQLLISDLPHVDVEDLKPNN